MYEFFLRFCGVTIRVQAPFPVSIRRESIPFLLDRAEQVDISVAFESVSALPEMDHNVLWQEDRCYTCLDGTAAVFVRNYPGEPPYALFRYEDRLVRCQYIPGSEIRLNESSSILNQIGLEKLLLDNSAFLLHSSFIRYRGQGILFSAPCGVGKSTQASLWEKYRNARILNGDRAGIRFQDGSWTAYGMPFAGSSGIYRNDEAPLGAIVTLAQGPENVIRRLRPMEVVRRLLAECSCLRWDSDFMGRVLDLLLKLAAQIPVYHLECRPDQGAVELLEHTLQKDGLL